MRGLCLAAVVLTSGAARAENPCAGLDVTLTTACQVSSGEDCAAMCGSVRFDTSCAAELYETCSGGCTGEAAVDCTSRCQVTCSGACAADPGLFDCSGQCEGACSSECTAQCGADAMCRARCGGYCSGECEAQCMGTPSSASCEVKCDASCQGSCEAEANFDCHMACQTNGYAACEDALTTTCSDHCRGEGALVCDGQFVAAADLDACVAFLQDGGVTVEGMSPEGGGGGVCGVSAEGMGGGSVLVGVCTLLLLIRIKGRAGGKRIGGRSVRPAREHRAP
jgi:hypothetical protein